MGTIAYFKLSGRSKKLLKQYVEGLPGMEPVPNNKLHVTCFKSTKAIPFAAMGELKQPMVITPDKMRIGKVRTQWSEALVVAFKSDLVFSRWQLAKRMGGLVGDSHTPHLTLTQNFHGDIAQIPKPNFNIELVEEVVDVYFPGVTINERNLMQHNDRMSSTRRHYSTLEEMAAQLEDNEPNKPRNVVNLTALRKPPLPGPGLKWRTALTNFFEAKKYMAAQWQNTGIIVLTKLRQLPALFADNEDGWLLQLLPNKTIRIRKDRWHLLAREIMVNREPAVMIEFETMHIGKPSTAA